MRIEVLNYRGRKYRLFLEFKYIIQAINQVQMYFCLLNYVCHLRWNWGDLIFELHERGGSQFSGQSQGEGCNFLAVFDKNSSPPDSSLLSDKSSP